MNQRNIMMIDPERAHTRFWLSRFLLVLLTLALGISLGLAVFSLPVKSVGMADRVRATIPHSGVTNPVTAVLLNFRAYDTLLEIGVLLLAVVGLHSFQTLPGRQAFSMPEPGPILHALVRLLVPIMVLVSGYFLWVGAHAPGGAFQGGAVLGAAAVLLFLAGFRLETWFYEWPFRGILVLGFTLFLVVGVGSMAVEGRFLEFPRAWAGGLILLVEAGLTVSIGCILGALFAGVSVAPNGVNRTKENP
jgi:multisubunit Na+/H+ antiporter MnhB subunit